MLEKKEFEKISSMVNPVLNQLDLNDIEKHIWKKYMIHEGDIQEVALQIGIFKSQVSRIVKRVFYKAEQSASPQ